MGSECNMNNWFDALFKNETVPVKDPAEEAFRLSRQFAQLGQRIGRLIERYPDVYRRRT